jgi:hypothetical protein
VFVNCLHATGRACPRAMADPGARAPISKAHPGVAGREAAAGARQEGGDKQCCLKQQRAQRRELAPPPAPNRKLGQSALGSHSATQMLSLRSVFCLPV